MIQDYTDRIIMLQDYPDSDTEWCENFRYMLEAIGATPETAVLVHSRDAEWVKLLPEFDHLEVSNKIANISGTDIRKKLQRGIWGAPGELPGSTERVLSSIKLRTN